MRRLPAWILCVLGPLLAAPQLSAQTGSISASPNPCQIASGKKTCTTTLSWSATGTSGLLVRVSRNGLPSTVLSSSGRSGSASPSWIQAAPTHTYTFYLYDYAGRVQGTLLDSVRVTGKAPPKPKPAPTIGSFSFSPTTIDKGKSSTLKWSTSNATSVSISPGIGKVSTSGSRSVSPSSTTTYTLTATNSVKSVTATARVTVRKPKPAVSGSISASPNPCQIAAGKKTCTTTLSWSATGTSGLLVRVSRNGRASTVVSSSGRSGSTSPSWIQAAPANTYTFYLYDYAGRVQGKLLDSVKVTGKAPPKPKPAPTISSFTASPTTIDKGKSSTLRWSTTDADTLSITPGIGTLTDAQRRIYRVRPLRVSPSKTTTYTLTAANSTKSVKATVTVTVKGTKPAPTISSFTATPATIDRGESSTLRWRTSNADSVSISASINPGVGTVNAEGSRVVSPTATTTYTLTATNSVGSATAKVTVRVRGAPQISGFTASPATIDKGKSSTLSWRTTDATSVSIDQGIGAVSASGSRKVSPSSTTTYTLTAANASGSVTATAKVTIRGSPKISRFTVTPETIDPGGRATLRWSTSNANSVSISPGIGKVSASGSRSVSPSSTTTYTLTATNSVGPVTATVTVTVREMPKISSFTATPTTIDPGESSVLKWRVTKATSLSISPGIGTLTPLERRAYVLGLKVSPSATTTYTLTATNSVGSVTATVTVTVRGSPTISSFTANPATIASGGRSTLRWSTTAATSLSIDQGVGTVTGTSVKVSPSATTTYTLTATNSVGSVTATVAVTIRGSPTISSFTASPAIIDKGKSATLRWSTTAATSLSIDQGVGTVTGTSVKVSPSATTTYTLTATNAVGSVTARATVQVRGAPKISSFTATPETIDKGESATLKWSTIDADTLSVTPGIGTLTDAQRRLYALKGLKVSPSVTTTYTLTATNAVGSATARATVTVAPPGPAPKINYFNTIPKRIDRGQSTTLRWNTTDATRVSIEPDIGAVSTRGIYRDSPSKTTTYTLTAANSTKSVTATVKVTVTAKEPAISYLIAIPARIDKGKSSTLRWSATNADTLSITPDIGPAIGTVTGTSLKVSPSSTTTYTLTATNPLKSVESTVTVTVKGTQPAPKISSFTATPTTIAQGERSTLRWKTSNADTLSISPGIGTLTDTQRRVYAIRPLQVSPTSTTTYTLTATNAAGSVEATAKVTVGAPRISGTISVATLNPCAIEEGADTCTATIQWTVENTNSVKVYVSANGGAETLFATATGDGSRNATGIKGSSNKYVFSLYDYSGGSRGDLLGSVTVTGRRVPTGTFTANPETIDQGQSATLSWSTSNADSVFISPGVGSVSAQGTREVSPNSTTTYTLNVTNAARSVKLRVTVTVRKTKAPKISRFTATPETINKGSRSMLRWSTSDAETLSITPGIGTLTDAQRRAYAIRPLRVSPSETTTYTLTATNRVGSVTATVKVTVREPTPVSGKISVSPDPCTIYHGQTGCTPTVTWESKGATDVQVWYSLNGGEEQFLASSGGGGPYSVQLDVELKQGYSIDFKLYDYSSGTRGALLKETEKSLTVQVDIGCPPSSN